MRVFGYLKHGRVNAVRRSCRLASVEVFENRCLLSVSWAGLADDASWIDDGNLDLGIPQSGADGHLAWYQFCLSPRCNLVVATTTRVVYLKQDRVYGIHRGIGMKETGWQ